jgi:hypothetical protein
MCIVVYAIAGYIAGSIASGHTQLLHVGEVRRSQPTQRMLLREEPRAPDPRLRAHTFTCRCSVRIAMRCDRFLAECRETQTDCDQLFVPAEVTLPTCRRTGLAEPSFSDRPETDIFRNI